MAKALTVGTRVRMKVQTSSGWNGTGTVIRATWTGVTLVKDGYPLHSDDGTADACRYDVAVLRDQTPPGADHILNLVIKRLQAVEGMSLTRKGVVIHDDRTSPAEVAQRQDDQAYMFTDEALEQLDICRRYITENLGPQDYDGKLMSSFYLTQHAGEWAGKPISNGMLCAAAVTEGYVPCHVEGYGCWFYVNRDRVDEIRRTASFLSDT